MDPCGLPDHVRRNRDHWDRWAASYEEPGRRNWQRSEPHWGLWHIDEREVQMFPDELAGSDAIELGCGTAYVSAWLARRGARPTGIDNSPAQLENARRFQREFGLEFPLMLGNAESVPLPDASFDFAISEYGASIWCDPYRWIPEAARVLRRGGRMHFLINSPLMMLCSPDEEDAPAVEQLLRPYFGMHRMEWSSDESVEFHLPHGQMLRLLRGAGFDVEDLVELQPPLGSSSRYPYVTLDWARKWPAEEVWKARKIR